MKKQTKKVEYVPTKQVLERYATVLVRFALGNGKGIKKGDVVYITVPEVAKPLLAAVCAEVTRAGGHVLLNYEPSVDPRHNLTRDFLLGASGQQLDFFPEHYYRGIVTQADHILRILGETDPHALSDVDPKLIMRRGIAMKPYRDMRTTKEQEGKQSWCIALYGTPAMAAEAGLSIEAYWREITRACFLTEADPIARWRAVTKEIGVFESKLSKLSPKIDKLHVTGPDADLWVTLGESRKWLSGRGCNIPSFEIFTSPDWRGTEGWIRFNQPLYRFGTLVTDIELHFKKGKVVKSSAKTGEKVLREMLATKGADQLGEFSLTDRRHSRIRTFMAETLYDENVGGPHGNTHIALGASFPDTYLGDQRSLTAARKEELGYNDSSIHTDIISTAPRTVTAQLKDGTTRVIYDKGQFVL